LFYFITGIFFFFSLLSFHAGYKDTAFKILLFSYFITNGYFLLPSLATYKDTYLLVLAAASDMDASPDF